MSHVQKLGYGYNSKTNEPTGTICVLNDFISTGGRPNSSLKMSSSLSYSELQKMLKTDVGINIKTKSFTFNLEADYLNSIKESDYSISFSILYSVEFETKILEVKNYGENALNNFGKGVLAKGLDHFRDVCGDQFASQENLGAMLITTLKVVFNSKQAKKDFQLNLKAGMQNLGSLALNIKQMSEEIRSSSTVELTAMQKGGDVKMLSRFLGNDNPSGDVDIPIMSCNFLEEQSIKRCMDVIENMIRYARGEFADSIRDNGEQTNKSSISYSYLNFIDIGINKLPDYDAREIVDKIKEKYSFMSEKLHSIKKYVEVLSGFGVISGGIEQSALIKSNSDMTGTWSWNPIYIGNQEKYKLKLATTISEKLLNAIESQSLGMPSCDVDYTNCEKVDYRISKILNLLDESTNSFASKEIANTEKEADFSYPSTLFGMAYKLNVYCKDNSFTGRVLFPVGNNRYYEDSKFQIKDADAVEIVKFFNDYTIDVDSNMIQSFKVRAVTDKITEYHNCGEIKKNDAFEEYDGVIRNKDCIMALCSHSGSEIEQFVNVEIFHDASPL